jgi:hypothetical protein
MTDSHRRQMSHIEAVDIAARIGVPIDADFFTFSRSQVEALLIKADNRRYKRPRNANGSRGRTFWAYIQRRARA